MNKHDRDNLHFLLTADKETMDEWYRTVTSDDVKYALELLDRHKTELMVREMELDEPGEDLDLAEANAVLEKFML